MTRFRLIISLSFILAVSSFPALCCSEDLGFPEHRSLSENQNASYVFLNTQSSRALAPAQAMLFVQSTLLRVREEFARIFHLAEPPVVTFRFVGDNSGLPRFARALFLRDSIFIPISPAGEQVRVLERAVRHEYAHAVVAQLSHRRAPAWLDEGLAQYFEGITPDEERRMREALDSPTCSTLSPSFAGLVHGFTDLSEDCARKAYAYSYRAVRELIMREGMSKMLAYLRSISSGEDIDLAFQDIFLLSWSGFQAELRQDG